MASGQEDHLGSLRRLRPGRLHLGRQRRLGGPQVEPGERLERLRQRLGVGRHEGRELVEDPGDLLGFGDLGLAPGVAEFDRHERLDEQGLATPRRVVDDPLDPGARLGLDGHDIAPVAQGDDRLLERTAEFCADEGVEPATEPLVGDPHGGPQATEPGRGRIEQFAHRIEAAGQGRSQGGQGMQVAGEIAQERATVVGDDGRQPRGRIEGLRDLQELGGFQASAADRTADRRSDVAGGTDPGPRTLAEERSRLVRLVEPTSDDDRVARRLEGLRQPT